MEKEIQQIQLFERIRAQSRWVFVESNLKEDLAQEAYLLAVEYAEKNNKSLSELSNTEIKFRCFEAARKLKGKEILLPGDDKFIESIPSSENVFEDFAQAEEEKISSDKIASIELLLKSHPALNLTPTQWEIYEELKNANSATIKKWQIKYAKKIGVSRQNVHNIVNDVRRKFEFANDFTDFCEGNVLEFFAKYGRQWFAPFVWKSKRDIFGKHAQIPSAFRGGLKAVHDKIRALAEKTLLVQARTGGNNAYDPQQLALAYNLLIAVVYTDPQKAQSWLSQLQSEITKENWLIKRFIDRCLHLTEDNIYRIRYKEWLKFLNEHVEDNEESKWFAGYVTCYYGGNAIQTNHFLRSGGKVSVSALSAEPIIKEAYKHTRERYYLESENLLDVNFLRLLLILRHYPQKNFSTRSANSITTICQKSTHSKDPYVAKEAEKLLVEIRNSEIAKV